MIRRNIVRIVHIVASLIAFTTIIIFQGSSIWSEFLTQMTQVAAVKTAIVWGLSILIPALALTGATGFAMAGHNPKGLAGAKARRMKFVAFNGIVLLVPAALFLNWKANMQLFDGAFIFVQIIEYVAGLANIALIGLNFRDGLKLARHSQKHGILPGQ